MVCKDEILFCCRECMTGTVVYDEYGHFKNIKDYLCRFVVPFQGIKFNSFQSTSSTIGELKQTISFNISGSNINNQNLVVQDIIFSGRQLEENIILKDKFSTKSENHVNIMLKNFLNWVELVDNCKDCISCDI